MSIEKTLKECLFTYFYSKKLLPYKQLDLNKIDKLYEHFLFYQGRNFNKLLELFPVDSIISYKREVFSKTQIKDKFNRCNLKPYYINITTEDVKKTGFVVIKVIVPGMIDLQKTHKLPRLNASRYKTVPIKLKFRYNRNICDVLHPFP